MAGFYSASCRLAAALGMRQLRSMSDPLPKPTTPEAGNPAKRPLPPAAERALAEAAARRAERDRHPVDAAKEIAGRDGLDPTRYGDWEINGLTSDF
jgi:hypothetical protein